MQFDKDDNFNIETPETAPNAASSATDAIRRKLERRRRWRERRKLVLVFVLILALVVALVVAANLGWSPAFLQRLFGAEEQGSAYEFSFEPHSGNVYASLESGLVIASEVGLEYISGSGEAGFRELYGMSRPSVTVNGSLGAIWDTGAETVRYFTAEGVIHRLDTANAVISVELNSAGWSAVSARESGYRGAVTVYDAEFAGVYKWFVSSGYICCAAVSEDSTGLCAVSLSQSGVDIESTAHFFTLTSEEEAGSYTSTGEVFLDVGALDAGGYFAVSDKAVYIFSDVGELISRYDFEERYLIAYSAGEADSLCLVLSAYSSGTKCDIIMLDGSGRVKAEAGTEEEVKAVSCGNDFVTVLYNDRAERLTTALRLSETSENITGIKAVITRDDDSVLLIGSDAATVF